MNGALAVFAKTPGLSPVKTRLAADVGARLAEKFYRLSLAAAEEVAARVRDLSEGAIRPVWALAERNGGGEGSRKSFPSIWTGDGDLGKRLHSVYSSLFKNHDYVMMMGTDSPQLEPSLILEAGRIIFENPESCVVGPSHDGGFYLFGGKIPIPESAWTGVAYSTNSTLRELARNLESQNIPVRLISEQGDVDSARDLKTLMNALEASPDLLPAQRRLLAWLRACKETLGTF
ncbi:MAG: DUF2064 domain-containing protein [Nitrospinae bacterium]|nr:DUF2064 domain-containing protein [Nitrospinota bacterium]